MGKEKSFRQIKLEKLDIHLQKNEVRPLLYIIHKSNSEWVIDLNACIKTIKL